MTPLDSERAALLADLATAQAALEASVMVRMTAQLMTMPLTMQQLKVLAVLVTETDGNTVQGLATTLGVSLATMSGILDRLTTHGMAARTEDPNDHRVRRIVATDTGRATVRRLLAAHPQMDPEPLERMAISDLRALNQGVQALVGAVAEAAARTEDASR